MKQWTALLLLVGMAHFSAHSASARTACKTACGDEFRCEIKGAKCLIDSGQISDAIDHLKEILAKRPGDPVAGRLLALAYLKDQNPFWAERTILQVLEMHKGDCETKT